MSDSGTSGYNQLLRLMRLPRLYRLLKISRIFKALRIRSNSELIEKIQDVLNLKQSFMRILWSLFTVGVCVHIMSCFWYFAAKLEGFGPDTWVYRNELMDEPSSYIYMVAFYFAVASLTTVGYGDVAAETFLERMLAMIWMVFGVIFFSFTIGNLTSVMENMQYKENTLQQKLHIIDELCKEAHIGKDIKKKLNQAIIYSNEKAGWSWIEKADVFNSLPTNLRYEIAVAMYQGALR